MLDLAPALTAGDHEALDVLFTESYIGARDLYEIGAPSMETMIEAMRSGSGVVAARQTGAGFGGCMVALVQQGYVDEFSEHVASAYQAATGIQPQIFEITASPGAGLLVF